MKAKSILRSVVVLALFGCAFQSEGSLFTKVRDATTHPFVMVEKKADQILSVPKKADAALESGNSAADAAAAAAAQAGSAAEEGRHAAEEGQITIKHIRLPLEILFWSLAVFAAIKTLKLTTSLIWSPARSTSKGNR